MATTTNPRTANTGKSFRVVESSTVAADATGESVTTVVVAEEDGAGGQALSAPSHTLTFTARNVARGASQFLIGSVPGRGSDRSATFTEAVDW
jgi:hypothetical protein